MVHFFSLMRNWIWCRITVFLKRYRIDENVQERMMKRRYISSSRGISVPNNKERWPYLTEQIPLPKQIAINTTLCVLSKRRYIRARRR